MLTTAQLRSSAPKILGRALLTLPYWWGGLSMLTHGKAAMAQVARFDLAPTWLTVALIAIIQIGGAALLIVGCHTWLAACALIALTVMESLMTLRFWDLGDPMERFYVTTIFLQHIALIGGLFLAAAMLNQNRRRP